MRSWSGEKTWNRAAWVGAVSAWALAAAVAPVRLLAAPATLTAAPQQRLVQQYCIGCHNYDDYAGGVEFEVFDATKAHENAALQSV